MTLIAKVPSDKKPKKITAVIRLRLLPLFSKFIVLLVLRVRIYSESDFKKKSFQEFKCSLLGSLAVFLHALVEVLLGLVSASFLFLSIFEGLALSHLLMMTLLTSGLAVGLGSTSTAVVQAFTVVLASVSSTSLLLLFGFESFASLEMIILGSIASILAGAENGNLGIASLGAASVLASCVVSASFLSCTFHGHASSHRLLSVIGAVSVASILFGFESDSLWSV